MTLSERLHQPVWITGEKCRVARIIDELSEDDQATLLAWFDTSYRQPGHVPNHRIAKALTAEGYHVREGTVANHRAGRCACYGAV